MGAPSRVLVSAGLILALALPAMAGDGVDKDKDKDSTAASAPRPKPAAIEKKIYTNEDVEALAARYGASTVGQAAPEASPAPVAARPIARPAIAPRTVIVTLAPEKDPARYGRDYASLQARIDAIDAEVAQLRNFRASDAAPGAETPGVTVGLDIYAPCDGISTDNKINDLLQQRSALEAEMSNLEDTAQANGIRLGELLSAASAAQAATPPPASPAATREALAQIETRLATLQGEQIGIQQATTAAGFTIAPETKFGGTYQSSYLKRLDNQASTLQSQLSTAEDEARRSGVPPATLP